MIWPTDVDLETVKAGCPVCPYVSQDLEYEFKQDISHLWALISSSTG